MANNKLVTYSLKPTTNGTVYTISPQDYYSGREPTQQLHHSHPFQGFWRDFILTIATPCKCERLVDAFITICANGSDWRKELTYSQVGMERDKIVKTLTKTAPDLLLISQSAQEGLGVHIASPCNWQCIGISEQLVEQWTKASSVGVDLRYTVALEAVMKATIVHELAAWILALRTGNISEKARPTIKIPETTWAKESGNFDAGDYVEVAAGGGIYGFDTERDDIFIRSGIEQVWSPRTSFLRIFRAKGYARFKPDPYDIQTAAVTAMPAYLQAIARRDRLPVNYSPITDLLPSDHNAIVPMSKTFQA